VIDRVHTKYGQSFKGCAAYLLHDKNADTRERIAWTETRNMATSNPDAAWRVMAATAQDQDRLKREAGIRPGGKPGKGPVLHFTLSWHEEEAEGLTRDEMMRAANGAIRAVRLEDRQALIVCHNDEPQPHVHILLNRVSPEDGRLPRDYNDFRKLSRWAQKYEKERGKIYCDQRVINEKARERGEYVKADGNKPRHLVEMQQAVNDNEAKKQLEEQHRKVAHAIKERERRQQERHERAWAELERLHKERIAKIEKRTSQAIAQGKQQIRNQYRPLWDAQYHEHQAQLRRFEQDEERAIGRLKNAMKSIDFRSLIGRGSDPEDGRAKTISQAFELLGSAGARLKAIEKQQQSQERDLEARQKQQEAEITQRQFAEQERLLEANRRRLDRERNDLVLLQAMEQAKTKADWLQKGRDMRKQFERLKEAERSRPQPERGAATQSREQDAGPSPANEDNRQKKTNPGDLLPKEGSDQAARQIDDYAERFGKRHDRGCFHDQDRDRDDEREF